MMGRRSQIIAFITITGIIIILYRFYAYFSSSPQTLASSTRSGTLVVYSGVYRIFPEGFRGFVRHIVAPNPLQDFVLVFHTDNEVFCSAKDHQCSPDELTMGQCNMCACLEKPKNVEKEIRKHYKSIMREEGIPESRVKIEGVFIQRESSVLSRLKKAWLQIKMIMDVFSFQYVLYMRPDASPTHDLVFDPLCDRNSMLTPGIYIMSGEVDRGSEWPLHNRDYDLGFLSCHPYHADIFFNALDKPCSDVWPGCGGIMTKNDHYREPGAGQPPALPPVSLGSPPLGSMKCEFPICSAVAEYLMKGIAISTLDAMTGGPVYSRIHRMGIDCEITYQQK